MLVASPFNSFTPPHFILMVKTDNSGVSDSNQFTLPTAVGRTYDYQIDWGDGTVEYYTTDAPQTHTYTVPGTYEIQIYGTFPGTNFVFGQPVDFGKVIKIKDLGRVGWEGNVRFEQLINLTEITNPGDTSGITSFAYAWRNCSSLTSFPLIDTSNGTNFFATWLGCSSLTSLPLIDTSRGTNFSQAWENCTLLASIPLIDTSNATTLLRTFNKCHSLTATPSLNTSNVIDFNSTFRDNHALSLFSFIDVSKGTTFNQCWVNNYALANFPANLFDTWVGVPVNQCFRYTWKGCINLTAQSVENILVSIDTSGVNAPGGATAGDNYIEIGYNVSTGGLTTATNTAITNLKGKGWEPFINGVLV